MERSLLGIGPAGTDNKRKRDVKAQHIASMMQGNPKMLLADSPIFHGITQQQLPFSVSITPSLSNPVYQASIRLPLPDGREAWGTGSARTKKEAERIAAVDACQKLNELGFLVGDYKSNCTEGSNGGWGENPKNILIRSVAFRSICCGPNAKPLPIGLRSSGPDHSKVFVAELTVPLPGKQEVFTAVGEGRNKGEAERACCYVACEKLLQEGVLTRSGDAGGVPVSSFSKALHIHQQSEQPAIISFRDEELAMMEDALYRLHVEMEEDFAHRICQLPSDEAQDLIMQKEVFDVPSSYASKEHLDSENATLCLEARNRLSSPLLAEQWQARQSLPLWRQRQMIVDMVAKNQVVVLTGETGCGKTTQVPQFVLEDHELNGCGAEVRIVVTQPRRIAAISIAERVAWERAEALGKSVGYSISLESVRPRPWGSILYCTTGVLLRRLQSNNGVAGITHIVIDEVHERDLETDFLLVVVRQLLHYNSSLRVIIMSATLDSSIYTSYFNNCPAINVPGMMHPVQVYYLENLPSLMGQHSFIVPKRTIADDEEVDVDLVANVISWIVVAFAQMDGAVLCFLPGLDHIIMVKDRIQKMCNGRNMMVLPLHSQLPAGEQRAAFARAPAGRRKVVLATNIAETSVTIDDVVFVVDSGKVKEKMYDPSRNMNILRVQWTSQASARQRQGRAGRVRAGLCFRLYTNQVFTSMQEHQVPEMQRVPLEELCLQIKALAAPSSALEANSTTGAYSRHSDILTFLSKALQPPKVHAVHVAIKVLQDLGAIDRHEELTALGMTLAKLAVSPRFGKMLIYGALLGCLEPLLTIAAAACFRDPFVAPIHKRDEADRTRESFSVRSSYGSDQLGLVNAFEQWLAACSCGQGNSFCEENFLAPATMRLIAGMRKQLKRTLVDAGIQEQSIKPSAQASVHVARSLLVAGLYPNFASSEFCRESRGVKHAQRWRLGFKVRNGRVLIHPTSVVQEKQLKPESHYYLVFQEKVQTSQVFVRGCTLLPPLPVVLLGWNIKLSPEPTQLTGDWMLLEVEGWLKFVIDRRRGSVLLQLRDAFHKVLGKWASGGVHRDAERHLVKVVISLLEESCNDMFTSVA